MPDDVDDDTALRWWTRGASVRPADPDEIRAMEPSFLSEQFLSFKKKDPTP
jgi:hypothetical protein